MYYHCILYRLATNFMPAVQHCCIEKKEFDTLLNVYERKLIHFHGLILVINVKKNLFFFYRKMLEKIEKKRKK